MTDSQAIYVPRDEVERLVKLLQYQAHPYPSPHAEFWQGLLDKPAAQPQVEADAGAAKCDQDIYANGHSVCLVDIPKDTAETICRNVSAVTGCKVDWHYIGGRVHIKALQAEQPAPAAAVLSERSPKDYAIEHAEYMAKSADDVLAQFQAYGLALLAVDEGGDDGEGELFENVDAARSDLQESLLNLRSMVYEFRKRRDRIARRTRETAQ
ncbi:hypothetical protein [Pseudomonas shahriarae]|uniref:hypothetical protein n=1 Tax=Pseudomonas shahriarae TaxID=2745512 RepID=UPI0023621B6D|nr:hypothetical protein [Pseudomonas shahriarae]MDD0981334.1 hypothetical protein [Pseudomonas shahriarae]